MLVRTSCAVLLQTRPDEPAFVETGATRVCAARRPRVAVQVDDPCHSSHRARTSQLGGRCVSWRG